MLKQKGLTLVELMIALLIAGVVVAAVMGIFVSAVTHTRVTIEQSRLDNDMFGAMNAIVRDVRRAGYWASASTSATNPFMQSATDITINATNDCILLSYDHNDDGALPAVNSGTDDERYGYRLMNGAIQFRTNSASFSCSASATNWTNFTDPNIVTITAFTVTKTTKTASSMELRTITITMTGQLVSEPSITKTLTQTVKVQNDRYVP